MARDAGDAVNGQGRQGHLGCQGRRAVSCGPPRCNSADQGPVFKTWDTASGGSREKGLGPPKGPVLKDLGPKTLLLWRAS